MAAGGKRDKKHDETVCGQERILSEIDDVCESMSGQFSNVQNTLERHAEMRSSRKPQSGAVNKSKETVAVQETHKGSTGKETSTDATQQKKLKLSKEMPLKVLWADQGFRDEFTKRMNVKYHKTSVKHWLYLGEKFCIERETLETFGISDYPSPSESMFQEMERRKPYLNIEDLCEVLKKANASNVLDIIEKAIQGQEIRGTDFVSDMWDKSPKEFEQVILNLDRNVVWKNVGRLLGFTRRDLQSFERDMDPTSNLTRVLFDVLRTQRPQLKVKDFEKMLKDIKQPEEGVLKILEDDNIKGDMLLRKLSEMPNVMLEIEHILNDPRNQSLWCLAESFKCHYAIDIDVEMFRPRGTDSNPTYHLMEYVTAYYGEKQKIKHLMIHLATIGREDCLEFIAEYLEDGDQEVKKLCPKVAKHLKIRRVASEQDNSSDSD